MSKGTQKRSFDELDKKVQTTSLLLVGRSGHGKSSTGNSILGEEVFETTMMGDSCRDGVREVTREVHGKDVQIVDATGLVDNDQEYPDNADHFIYLANKAMEMSSDHGYAAIVLVLRYGIRFSRQESVAVKFIRSLFGPEVIQRHGVIVMTCGDHFEADMKDEGVSFHQWCQRQEGEAKQLMEECGHRVVLFDNKTRDPDHCRQQVKQLMVLVDRVSGQAGPYSRIKFQDAEPERSKLQIVPAISKLKQELRDSVEAAVDSHRRSKKNKKGCCPCFHLRK